MKKILLIQGSLNPTSTTAKAISTMASTCETHGLEVETLDLRQIDMPWCDGRKTEDYPAAFQEVYNQVQSADAYIIGMPVYCYSISGPLKNFIDLTVGAMQYKPFGVVLTAGTPLSYVAGADLQKVLTYEAWGTALMPLVMTTSKDYDGNTLTSDRAKEKMNQLAEALKKNLS